MRERVLRRALLASIAVLAVPATASADVFTYVTPVVQGAGTVTVNGKTCTQAPPVSDGAQYTCPQISKVVTAADPSIDLTATAPDGWKFVNWTGCTKTSGATCTITPDNSGSGKDILHVSPVAAFADSRPPKLTTPVAVPSATKDLAETITWDANEPGVSYKCSFDGAKPVPCATPLTFEGDQRKHTVDITGTDPSGLVSGNQRVDFMLMDTTLTGGPAEGSVTTATSASFTAASGLKGGSDFECSLDGGAWRSCRPAITLTGLADGGHELRVRARVGESYDGIPSVRKWTVDTTPPETLLNVAGGALQFKASEPGSTFECRLDGGLFTLCKSPQDLPKLAPGDHVFEVRASDALGNTDLTPARYAWTVAAPPAPTPASTATPTPEPVVIPAPAPAAIAAAPSKPNALPALAWRYRNGRFTRLEVTGLPAGAKLTVLVTEPHRKPRTLSSLKPLIGKRLKPGTKIAVIGKTITIRRGRAPKVA
jgi:hypothetical protein